MDKFKAFLALKLLQSCAKGKGVKEHYLHAAVVNGKASVSYQKADVGDDKWYGFRLQNGKFLEDR